jgi:hypothetical protein
MRFSEAMKALEEGKKVRACSWPVAEWLSNADESDALPCLHLSSLWCCEWELYQEPEQTFSFAEVVKGLKEGKKFSRAAWKDRDSHLEATECIYFPSKKKINNQHGKLCALWLEDYEATDWVEIK